MGTAALQTIQPAAFGKSALKPADASSPFLLFEHRQPVFDSFQRVRTAPIIQFSQSQKFLHSITHFFLSRTLGVNTKESGESAMDRVEMYREIKAALSREGAEHFKSLLQQGVLTDITADDKHSTLYHLYAMLTTPRARGYKTEDVLNETVRILNKPYLITQKFPTLSENMAKQILQVRNNPTLNRAGEPPPPKTLTRSDLNVSYSSDCVPSSVMYYMADKNPSELARHLCELTSPLEAFYEKAKLSEISPENPADAIEILKYYDIPYQRTGPDEVTVKVELPVAGKLRAINDSQKHGANGGRTGVESAYESALAYLPTRTYDPATGERDAIESTVATIYQIKSLSDQEKQDLATILQNNKSPLKTRRAFMNRLSTLQPKLSYTERTQIQEALQASSKGLTEMEKTLLETIIKDNGGVSSITYQVVAGKANPKPGEEIQSFLYGYTRPFEQTTADMVEALKMGEFVIIGITDTDASGAIVGGHEITLTGAFVDKKDGEIKFTVVDSDDDIPTPVVRSAKELIPRIHHAGMPNKLAKAINDDMKNVQGYFVPNAEDYARFTPLDRLNEPLPADALPQQETEANAAPAQPNPAPAPVHPEPVVQPPANQPVNPPAVPAPWYPQQPVQYIPVYPPYMPSYSQPNPFAYPMVQPVFYYPQMPYTPTGWQPVR